MCVNFSGSSRKVGEANKGLGEALKSCTRKEHESATNPIAKRGQGAIAPCRVKGQRPLWGLGQRPNCSVGDQHHKCTQQRRRQRSVPASNFARPQTRPQAALPPRFRDEPIFAHASPNPHILRYMLVSFLSICYNGMQSAVFGGNFAGIPRTREIWRIWERSARF